MTSPSLQAIPQVCASLDLGQAARLLQVSRARLAELVLDGYFALDSEKRIAVEQLERYQPASDDVERLPRVQDAVLWLLEEWGSGTTKMLTTPLRAKVGAVNHACRRLEDMGYVTRPTRTGNWVLTSLGKDYISKVAKPM